MVLQTECVAMLYGTVVRMVGHQDNAETVRNLWMAKALREFFSRLKAVQPTEMNGEVGQGIADPAPGCLVRLAW